MIDKSNQRVRDMFAQIAGKYDRMNHLLSGNVDRYWRWQTVRQVPARGPSPILDLCTGTGDLAFAYHKATRGQVPIVAADFCREMLEVGEMKKRRRAIGDTIEFVEADAQQLPFPSDHFQIACVAFGLRNVADTDLGLREMVRVVQPGGRVAVLEFSSPERQPMKFAYGFYFRNVLPRIGQLLAKNDRQAYSYLPESVGHFPCGAALAKRMQAAGLDQVSYTPLTFGIATLYVGHKPAPSPAAP
jgi:demethylmenaquinone methyltransferase/2-methoxy-6-polyprenyl-1,4-benzoquinol methylase